MQSTLVFDSCSFTVEKTKQNILILVNQATQLGTMIQMDENLGRAFFKGISTQSSLTTSKVLGVKLSCEEQLQEQMTEQTGLTVVMAGDIATFDHVQANFVDIRNIQP